MVVHRVHQTNPVQSGAAKIPDLSRRRGLAQLSAASPVTLAPWALAPKPMTVGVIYVGPKDDFGYFDPHMLAVAAKNSGVRFSHCGGMWTWYAATEMSAQLKAMESARVQGANHGNTKWYCEDLQRRDRVEDEFSCFDISVAAYSGKHPDNTGGFFGYIDEAQYLDGVVADHTSKSKKIGFLAAKPIPQVLRDINAFTLGARSVDPKITTSAIFIGDWSLPVKEAEATNGLADQGVDVFTMHVDGPKVVVETAAKRGKMVCGCHASQAKLAPNVYLTGAEWNWITVYTQILEAARSGAPHPDFVRGGLKEGFVKTSAYGPTVSEAARKNADAEGQDDGRRLRHLCRRDEGQHRKGRHPERQGLQADRTGTRRHELPRRRRAGEYLTLPRRGPGRSHSKGRHQQSGPADGMA